MVAAYHEPDVSLAAARPEDPVAAVPGRDIGAFFADDGKRRQDIDGFEDVYADIVHYIIRCTHRIWEEGGIGLLYTHYAHNLPLHTSEGTVYGREAVIASTQRTQAAYPDLSSPWPSPRPDTTWRWPPATAPRWRKRPAWPPGAGPKDW